MASRSTESHKKEQDKDLSTPLSFYIFIGVLAVALLGALWAVVQMTFL